MKIKLLFIPLMQILSLVMVFVAVHEKFTKNNTVEAIWWALLSIMFSVACLPIDVE